MWWWDFSVQCVELNIVFAVEDYWHITATVFHNYAPKSTLYLHNSMSYFVHAQCAPWSFYIIWLWSHRRFRITCFYWAHCRPIGTYLGLLAHNAGASWLLLDALLDTLTLYAEKTIFSFSFKLNGIWSWWQFSFRFWKKIEFHLVQNRNENCHHDHIPFNLKGNGNRVFSVKAEFGSPQTVWCARFAFLIFLMNRIQTVAKKI